MADGPMFHDAHLRKLTDDEAAKLIRLYDHAEREILAEVNKALARDVAKNRVGAQFNTSTPYMRSMLRNVRGILSQLKAGARQWSDAAIPYVYQDGLKVADQQLTKAGLDVKGGYGAVHQHAMKALADAAYSRFEDSIGVVGRRVNDIYRATQLQAVRGAVAGYQTYQTAARRLKQGLAEAGVTGFVDKAGRAWNMTDYARMAAITTTANAHWEGTTNRLLENGEDLVQISTHSEACELCAPWQGVVVSLSGETPGYPTMDEAIADGFRHPRCRHAFGLYIDLEAETKKAGANAEKYRKAADKAAKQRAEEEARAKAEAEAAAVKRRKPLSVQPLADGAAADKVRQGTEEAMLRSVGGRTAGTAEDVAGPVVARYLEGNADALAWADAMERQSGYDPDKFKPADRLAWVAKRVVSKWNGTSADSDKMALAMQIAAREEFGMDDTADAEWYVKKRNAQTGAAREEDPYTEAEKLYAEHGAGMRAVLRGMWQATQDWFKEQGIDQVPLARGVRWDNQAHLPKAPTFSGAGYRGVAEIVQQPLNSYSMDAETAYSFSSGGHYKMLVVAMVPAERILSIPATGSGTVYEREAVVLGGVDRAVAFTTQGRWSFYSSDVWRIASQIAREGSNGG